jgi:hypothetical protein
VPAPGRVTLTVAVKAMLWPDTGELAEELTSVLVAAWVTVCVSGVAVLPAKLASPVYDAAMVCMPGAKVAALNEAVITPPALLMFTGLPALLPSITNCTFPLGVPAPGAVILMVAAKLML